MHLHMLREMACTFSLQAEVDRILPLGSGHIHGTYHVVTSPAGAESYVLQKFNSNVFKNPDAVMRNLVKVTDCIQKKNSGIPHAVMLKPVSLRTGGMLNIDSTGQIWRCFVYIPGHVTVNRAVNSMQVYEGGRAYGAFDSWLSDLSVEEVEETIPGFHNMGLRIAQFQNAVKTGIAERIAEARKEIATLFDMAEEMLVIQKLGEAGSIPRRVVHHDTKINNVLFTPDFRALCVIDLDTVMPGYIHDDFGDAIRTFTNTGEEDDSDLSAVGMNREYFGAFAEGFLQTAGSLLSDTEIRHLALSARAMTYMQTLRFLSDYLTGDTYYHIGHPKHNWQRTKAQFELLMDMTKQYADMKRIIHTIA